MSARRAVQLAATPGFAAFPSIPTNSDRAQRRLPARHRAGALLLTFVIGVGAAAAGDSVDLVSRLRRLPDVVLTAGDTALDPAYPRAGEPVTIRATVRNLGSRPAGSSAVRAYEGEVGSGVLIAEVAVPELAPQGFHEASLTWVPAEPLGKRVVTVVADAAGVVAEQDEGNNRVGLNVVVQDADLYLTEPYFSPDHDGAKDETTLAYRVFGPVRVLVSDERGRAVRVLAENAPAAGLVTWDGRDARGVVAWDGSYTITLQEEGGRVLGRREVVLDTNHSVLHDAAGRGRLVFHRLACSQPDRLVGPVWMPSNEEAVVLDRAAPGGLLRIGLDARSVHVAQGPEYLDPALTFASPWAVSPDGREVLLVQGDALRAVDLKSGAARSLGFARWAAWSPDGRWIATDTAVLSREGTALASLPRPGEWVWSPDAERLAFHDTVVRRDGSVEVQFSIPSRARVWDTEWRGDGAIYVHQGEWIPSGHEAGHWRNEAFLLDPETRSVATLPWAPRGGGLATWSPDATRALVVNESRDDGTGEAGTRIVSEDGARALSLAARGVEPAPGSAVGHSWQGGVPGCPERELAAVSTADNITADLRLAQLPGGTGIVASGTAADRNLDQHVLEYAEAATPGVWHPIGAALDEPVVDDTLAVWIPAAPGSYVVRLTVRDRAGSVRQRSRTVSWNRLPPVSNLTQSLKLFSPNGDGVKDSVSFSYLVQKEPTLVSVRIAGPKDPARPRETAPTVRQLHFDHASAGPWTFEWDGRDDAGAVVQDGRYVVLVNDVPLPVDVDSTPPDPESSLALKTSHADLHARADEPLRAVTAQAAGPDGATSQSLTSADVLGPDGIVYPDWTYAGVPGGIPDLDNLTACESATTYGAKADDGLDDAEAIEKAARACWDKKKGGVVSLPEGTLHLKRPVFIRWPGVVLRGAGRDKTRIEFTYAPPTNGVTFYLPPDISNKTVYANNWIEAHADSTNLLRLTITAGNQKVAACKAVDAFPKEEAPTTPICYGPFYSVRAKGSALGAAAQKVVTATAEYLGPNNVVLVQSGSITLTLKAENATDPIPSVSHLGAINFAGAGYKDDKKWDLKKDGLRGDTSLTVASDHTIAAGDYLEIVAPSTERWNAEVGNLCTYGNFRTYQVKAMAVSTVGTDSSISINQPLRVDFPKIDGSYLRELSPLTGNGVADLRLKQTHKVWTSGIVFSWSWGSWAKNVYVEKAGRFPLYFIPGKFCEIRDSIFDDAWFKDDGGTAYVGFDYAYDCLMDNIEARKMRHAPLVQWSAAGNVVRRSRFFDSDIQWHAGWTNENLFEQCTVESNRGNGGYGYGMYATKPEDPQHGPNGPRNVVYNSDVTSSDTSVWLGGMNKGWIFAYNRMQADTGYGVFARRNSGGHVIQENVFALKAAVSGVRLDTADCTDVTIRGNDFYGLMPPAATAPAEVATGEATPSVLKDNTVTSVPAPATFPNSNLEKGDWTDWLRGAEDNNMSVVSRDAARGGSTWGIRVTDDSDTKGSAVRSTAFPVQPGKIYGVRYWQRIVSGGNKRMAVYLVFYDSTGKFIVQRPEELEADVAWRRVLRRWGAPPNAASARILLHSYAEGKVTADFDDFEFGALADDDDLADGGFEDGLTHWDTTGANGMSTSDTAAAYTKIRGLRGLRVADTSTTKGSSVASRKFPVKKDWTYQVRFWARQNSGADAIAVYLQFHDGEGKLMSQPSKQLPNLPEWREYTLRADAPTGASTVRVLIYSDERTQVSADFDGFVFAGIAPRPSPPVPSIFDWQRKPIFPMSNPGFELGLDDWTIGDGGMSAAVPAAARSGAKGLRVTDTSTTKGSSALSREFFVQPGKTYRASFWSSVSSGTSGLGVYLKFYDASGAEITSATANRTVPNSLWVSNVLEKAAPANAVTARIWIHSYDSAKVIADLDEFVFERR